MFNVDFVFPYVNPADETWQKSYKYFRGDFYKKQDERFRDFSLLKYIFRSIEANAPWINRVFVLVAYKSQIPEFLKTSSRLIFVEHKDFIPSYYLPTFNSNTIEMFLPFVPDLSEHFVYSNDDLLFLNKTEVSDFFISEKLLKAAYTFRRATDPEGFQASVKRTWDTVESFFGRKPNLAHDYVYLKQYHGCAAPRLLSDCKECFYVLQKEIENSLTLFRNVDRNLNQYLFGYYSVFKNHISIFPYKLQGLYVAGEDGKEKLVDAIRNAPARMICINDTAAMTDELIAAVYEELDKKFPNKSKFEV